MRPAIYPLDLYHGDSYSWRYVMWLDSDKTIPQDLTDVEMKAQIRNHPGGSTIITMTCTAVTGTGSPTVPNVIHVELTSDMWDDWPFGLRHGAWDLQLTYAGDFISTIVSGGVTVTQDITDSPEDTGSTSVERRVS